MSQDHAALLLLIAAGCAAPAPAPTTAPTSVPSPSSATASEPAEPAATTSAAASAATTSSATPTSAPTAGKVDLAAAQACKEAHRAALDPASVDYGPPRLRDAALCFERAGAIGMAIRMHGVLVREFPSALEARDGLRAMGHSYTGIGHIADAAQSFETYATRYPKEADARELLERAACMRMTLSDPDGANRNLAQLKRFYLRSYYRVAPTLDGLCKQEEPKSATPAGPPTQ